MNNWLDNNKRNLIALLCVSIIYVMPIVLTNSYYIDDMTKSLTGMGWDHDGRLLATKLMQYISPGPDVVDVYPFGQMLASFLISLSAYIVLSSLTGRNDKTIFLASALFLGSPFLLENLSYRFDALIMAISILSVCLPFAFYKTRGIFFVASFIGVFLSLMTYQASATSYFVVFAIFLARDAISKSFVDMIINSVIVLLSFVLAYLAFKSSLNFFDINLNGRNSLIFEQSNPRELLYRNTEVAKRVTLTLFNGGYLLFAAPVIASVVVAGLVILRRACSFRIHVGFVRIAIIALLVIAVVACIPGANLLLSSPWWTARSMVGYSFFVLFLVSIPLIAGLNDRVYRAVLVFAIIPSFTICAAYGSALHQQNEMTESIVSMTYPELSKYKDSDIVIDGKGPKSRRLLTIERNIPVVQFLVPVYMNNGWAWGINYFKRFEMIGDGSFISGDKRLAILSEKCSYEKVQENKFYNLMKNGKVYVIDFKKECT
ncbi:TPA: glucosyltransferase domain-containing protein [Citrobacter werkmanii]